MWGELRRPGKKSESRGVSGLRALQGKLLHGIPVSPILRKWMWPIKLNFMKEKCPMVWRALGDMAGEIFKRVKNLNPN